MLKAMHRVHQIDRKKDKDVLLMFGLNECVDHLAIANIVL